MPACKYGDDLCPCQDGLLCHYEGPNPMTPPSKPSDEQDGLGPLPEPDTHCFDDDAGRDVWSYSAAKMRAYATQEVAAERERWAATGRPGEGPRRGVIEDVADMRTALVELLARAEHDICDPIDVPEIQQARYVLGLL